MNKDYINKWLNYFKVTKKDINNFDDSFAGNVKFGTSGLRGIMGIGTNRINELVIARTSKGLANKVIEENGKNIIITYDSRINSKKFAYISSQVFTNSGLKVYITKTLSATPFLAFALRELKCDAGVVITASHNPKIYNGYKIYNNKGIQIDSNFAKAIAENISKLDFFDIKLLNFENELKKGNIKYIDDVIYKKYIDIVKKQSFNNCNNIKVCYTALNGGGGLFVPDLLKSKGAEVITVNEQINPDGNFTTCPYPNPEMEEALNLAKQYAIKNSCDIILANDPDVDRIGAVYFDGKNYIQLTGDEIGLIICNYLIKEKSKREDLKNKVIVRTVVTMRLIDKIAKKYGVKIIETLTGFKNICKQAVKMYENGESDKFIAGYEESNGIAIGTYAFDKDGICAAMILTEIATMLKEKGQNYGDYLNSIYNEYGIIKSKQIRINTENIKQTEKIMTAFRNVKQYNNNFKLIKIKDYINDKYKPYNLIVYEFENENVLAVRPSGTEPFIKIYMHLTGKNYKDNFIKLNEFVKSITDNIKNA